MVDMESKLLDACAVLGIGALDEVDPSVIRRAYRRLAISVHPDAAARRGGRSGPADGRRFVEASQAYELVMRHVLSTRPQRAASRPRAARAAARPRPAPQPRPAARTRPAANPRQAPRAEAPRAEAPRAETPRQAPRAEASRAEASRAEAPGRDAALFYRGSLPPHSLRLGEYLFYCGRISWQDLIHSLVWQRTIRPTFGQLARQLQYLSTEGLAAVLSRRRHDERTGAAATRLGLLSSEQVDRILRIQRARHRPIGRYFVEKQLLPVTELTRALRDLRRHNERCGTAA